MTSGQSRQKTYVKTVSFFRLIDSRDSSPCEQVNWTERIAAVSEDIRLQVAGNLGIDGTPTEYKKSNRLVLSRDRGNAPRQQNSGTGEKQAMPTRGAAWNVIEEGFATFLDVGNVFAFARSSAVAPGARFVADWINATGAMPDVNWIAEPMIDPDRYERLRDEGGVTMVDVVARPAVGPENPNSSLLRSIMALRDTGDVKIEVKISVNRGRRNRAEQQALRDQALELVDAIDDDTVLGIESAKAKKVGDPDPIDLLEHRITSKRSITLQLRERDRSLNETAVFDATDAVIIEALPSIRRILGQ